MQGLEESKIYGSKLRKHTLPSSYAIMFHSDNNEAITGGTINPTGIAITQENKY